MTDLYFFDTDCLSSFLLTNNEEILIKLFNKRIVLPSFVLNEANKYEPLKIKLEKLIAENNIRIQDICYGTKEHKIYHKLTNYNYTSKVIGKGEASAIALCVVYNGTLVSNNLKDVSLYINEYKLESLTTPDILTIAYEKHLINNDVANKIWIDMIEKGNYLPNKTFDDYYKISN